MGGDDEDKEKDEGMDGSDSGSDELHLGGQVRNTYTTAAAAAAHGKNCKKCTADDHSWMSIRWHQMTLLMGTMLLMMTTTGCTLDGIQQFQGNLWPRAIPDCSTHCLTAMIEFE